MTTRMLLALVSTLFLVVLAAAEDRPGAGEKPAYLGTETLESCVNRWDPGTHLTKEEWRASCERISEERGKYLKERGVVPEDK